MAIESKDLVKFARKKFRSLNKKSKTKLVWKTFYQGFIDGYEYKNDDKVFISTRRPPIYETAEDMQEMISDYLNNCPDKKIIITKEGKEIKVPKLTSSGLAYHLGFSSRQSLYDYSEKDEFSYTIKRAMLFIEKEYEMKLGEGNAAGIIFALKNFGWEDKSTVENTYKGFTDKELDEEINKLS